MATNVNVRFDGGDVHVYGDRIQSVFRNSFNVFSNFDVRNFGVRFDGGDVHVYGD